MNFTAPYDIFLFSPSTAWPQLQTPAPTTDPEIVNLAPPSPTTFPASPFPRVVDIPSAYQASSTSAHPVVSGPPPNEARRFASNGKPKSKQKELDPEEDIATTPPDAMVRCRWGSCTETFRAGSWTAHARPHDLRGMHRHRDERGHARCLWRGCRERLMPENMGKHVRSQHLRTYEVSCKYCGRTARTDSYLETHGLARDCPRRPGSSREASLPATASVAATPALSPSGSSAYSDPPSVPTSNHRFVNMPAESAEASEDWLPPVLPLLAKSLRDLPQRLAQGTHSASPPEAPPLPFQPAVMQTPVLAHSPLGQEPLLKPLEFYQFAPPQLVPGMAAFPDTPTYPGLSPLEEPTAGTGGWLQDASLPDMYAEEMSVYRAVANMTWLDESFVFDADASW